MGAKEQVATERLSLEAARTIAAEVGFLSMFSSDVKERVSALRMECSRLQAQLEQAHTRTTHTEQALALEIVCGCCNLFINIAVSHRSPEKRISSPGR